MARDVLDIREIIHAWKALRAIAKGATPLRPLTGKDIDAALKWQKKAVACSDDGPTGASIREVLDKYKKEKSQQ